MSATSISPTPDTESINLLVKDQKDNVLFAHATLKSGVTTIVSPKDLANAKTINVECRDDDESGAYEVTVTVEETYPPTDFQIGVAIGKVAPYVIDAPISHRVAMNGAGTQGGLQADVQGGTLTLRAI